MSAHRHILFDLDGTLIDSAPAILASYRDSFAAAGREPVRPIDVGRIVHQRGVCIGGAVVAAGEIVAQAVELRPLTAQLDASRTVQFAQAFQTRRQMLSRVKRRQYQEFGWGLESCLPRGEPQRPV